MGRQPSFICHDGKGCGLVTSSRYRNDISRIKKGLEGCIRQAFRIREEKQTENQNTSWIENVFGKEGAGEYASALSLSDARLLFFPVKSAIGVFAFVTCPLAVQRLCNDYNIAMGKALLEEKDLEALKSADLNGKAVIPEESTCELIHRGKSQNKNYGILLEEYKYQTEENEWFKTLLSRIKKQLPPDNVITKERFSNHAILVSDEEFLSFVKYSTEINTRIKIDSKTGTVEETALFTEELLPSESILYSMAFFENLRCKEAEEKDKNKVKEEFVKRILDCSIIQIGADSTLGKGLVMQKIWEEK